MLKFNCSKSITFLQTKQFVIELYDYEFTVEVKIEESEDDKGTPTMVIDENQDSLDEKTEEKWKMFLKPPQYMQTYMSC